MRMDWAADACASGRATQRSTFQRNPTCFPFGQFGALSEKVRELYTIESLAHDRVHPGIRTRLVRLARDILLQRHRIREANELRRVGDLARECRAQCEMIHHHPRSA